MIPELRCLSLAGLVTLAIAPLAAAHDRPTVHPEAFSAVRLAKDLNTDTGPVSFQRSSLLVPLGDAAFFLGGEGEWNSMESGLWVTDGSAPGTRLVRSFPALEDNAGAFGLVASGGRLFFFASNGGPDLYAWTSDGTAEGTRPLVRVGNAFFEPLHLVPVGGRVFFFAYPGSGIDVELWASDGTEEGTRALALFDDPGSVYSVGDLCAWGDRLAFQGWDPNHGSELWTSDGTPEGTRLFIDILPGSGGSDLSTLTLWKGRLYFVARAMESWTMGLWSSDGTASGTAPLPDGPELYNGDYVPVFPGNRYLYFWAYTPHQPPGLWRTDGGPAGTVYLKALELAGAPGFWADLSESIVLFNAYEPGLGYELWRSDGTPDGTRCVRDIIAGIGSSWPYGLTALGGAVYFSAYGEGEGQELWRSDGTGAGTAVVRDILQGGTGSSPDWLQAWQGRLWFMADDGAHGVEPWSSDGTFEGTWRFAGLAPDVGSSAIRSLVPWGAGGALLETEERADTPYQFWSSDGTPEGTQPFFTLDPAANWRPPGELASRGDLAFFPLHSSALGNEMWLTDGTAAGTRLVRDIVPGPADSVDNAFRKGAFLGADYFFSGSDGVHGLEPWATDGTEAGTRMAADVCTAPQDLDPTASSWPAHFTAGSGRVFFTARGDDGSAGWYATDGTGPGTRLLSSFGSQSDQIDLSSPAIAGGTAFLFTHTWWSSQWNLWRSDGTVWGTDSIATLYDQWDRPWTPGPLFAFGDRVFFQAAPWDGAELWTSDGTSGGTALLKDINPGDGDSFPGDFASLGNRFYFRADDGVHGAELWTSDGTEAGTFMLMDLCPGLCSGYPMGLTSDGSRIVFSATDGLHGHELWTTGGTPEGTAMAADIRPGPASSTPERITLSGATVYFTADDGRTGRELWRFDPAAPEP